LNFKPKLEKKICKKNIFDFFPELSSQKNLFISKNWKFFFGISNSKSSVKMTLKIQILIYESFEKIDFLDKK